MALVYVLLRSKLGLGLMAMRDAEYFSMNMLILGPIAILVILLAPKGIMGTLQEKLGFEILSSRRK